MSDLIDRQAAIDALRTCYDTETVTMDNGDEYINYGDAVGEIEQLPPAQLGTNLAEVGTDCISRQAAIDALDEQIAQCNKAIKSFVLSMKDEYAAKVEKASLTAFRERLEYLPPAQPEPCEDAVSRAEVLRMIDCINDHQAITPYKSVGAVTEHLTRIASSLQPVTPKQRTGKWERHYSRPNVYADLCWHCSACGYYHADNWTNKFKYCPNCGAKMEGDAK